MQLTQQETLVLKSSLEQNFSTMVIYLWYIQYLKLLHASLCSKKN